MATPYVGDNQSLARHTELLREANEAYLRADQEKDPYMARLLWLEWKRAATRLREAGDVLTREARR